MEPVNYAEKLRMLLARMVMSEETRFFGFAAKMLRVVLLNNDNEKIIAATDGVTLYLSPLFFKLSVKSQMAVLVHEILHIIQAHPARRKDFARGDSGRGATFDVAADALVNAVVEKLLGSDILAKLSDELSDLFNKIVNAVRPHDVAYAIGVNIDELLAMSAERIAELLLRRNAVDKIYKNTDRTLGDLLEKSRSDGEVLQEDQGFGGQRSPTGPLSAQKAKEFGRKIATRAYFVAKTVGNVPGVVERMVRDAIKEKIDWRRQLRDALAIALGEDVKMANIVVNKKLPGVVPGKLRLGTNIAVLIDVSGSIGNEELRQFMAELYAIAKASRSTLRAVFWDAEVQNDVEIKSPQDVYRVRPKGGGGTILMSAIEYFEKKYARQTDVLIVLSDWLVYDDRKELAKRLARLPMEKIFVTIAEIPPRVPGAKVIELRS